MELLNVPLQAVIWFGLGGVPVTAVNVVGFTLFALLLLEGAGYWAAKLQQVTQPGLRLRGVGAFAMARRGNLVLLAAGLLFAGWAGAVDPGAGTWPGLVFAIVAVLEHINYFHVQLMYDTAADLHSLRTHGLRRAHLARDLSNYAKNRDT
ncbi:hypothetical protein ACIBF1_06955 [Spirillospora sp. NPDC050679]